MTYQYNEATSTMATERAPQLIRPIPEHAERWCESLEAAASWHPEAFVMENGGLEVARDIFLRPSTRAIGYVAEDETVLAAASYTCNEAIDVGLLYRHPEAPAGLGRQALRCVLEEALAREECTTVMLQVRHSNTHARALMSGWGLQRLRARPASAYTYEERMTCVTQ